ncbi:ulp1 protease family, C-terminal catalytic domain-containing protein [Tanacetum coccineum]
MKDCLNDNFSKTKALLLDIDDKIKIALDENPEDSDLKIILGKRLALFKELNHCNDDNAMVFLDNGNDVLEESVKEMSSECENDNDSGKKEVEKNTEDLIKGTVVCVEISKKEVSKGVLAINEDPLKDSQLETSIFDSRPEDSQPEEQESQLGMEIGAEFQEENLEPVKNCETLKEADFPLIGLEEIESLKGGGRNLFDEKSIVQNVNEDDMILQDSLLNIPFLSTQEVACLEINTQKKPINELKGKSVNFEGGHPTIKRQQIKKEMEGDKNVPKTRAKKTDADKQDIKKPQVRKQTAAQLAKSKETKTKTIKPAPTKRKKKEPNDKEETAIHASLISFIHPPIDTESEKRQGKPSNLLVSPFYQRKVILDKPVSEEGKKIVEYIWSKNTPEGDKLLGDGNVYCHTVIMTQHSIEMGKDLEARRDSFDKNIDIVLKQVKRKNFKDVNLVFFPTIKMSKKSNHFYVICFNLKTSEIDIIDNIDNGIDDIKTRYGGFPCALMESFIDYPERKKHQNCYDLILAKPKLVEFPWKTTYNSHDCGVFVIRHMETYLGKVIFYKNSRKKDQKVQLNMMRTKYMVKILLMSFNEKKKTLLKQAQEYIKMKPKSSKVLTGNDVRVDE